MNQKKGETKKGVTILVIIALILAVTAISIRVMDSEKIPTTYNGPTGDNGGNVGVAINSPVIEDRLADETPGANA